MNAHASNQRSTPPIPFPGQPGSAAATASGAELLPSGWEARACFDGSWALARSGRARQALAIRWATLALATITGAVFLFGHPLLELVGRGIEPLALVLMGTGLVSMFWLEHRGPVYRLAHHRIERRSGLGGRSVRVHAEPSLVLTASGDDGWAIVLRHDEVPDVIANGLPLREALALAAFVVRHTSAHVDLPESLERELAEGSGSDEASAADAFELPERTGTNG